MNITDKSGFSTSNYWQTEKEKVASIYTCIVPTPG
jgi:hypothetical protein